MEPTTEADQDVDDGIKQAVKPLNVGVIGVGSMGHHHARVYNQLDGATLVGVADADETRAQEVAEEFDTQATSQDELVKQVDAVSIAVPTKFHRDIAIECIANGVHVLIEKPLAASTDDGAEILEAAESAGVTVQVGHIEQFNPAIVELSEIIDPGKIIGVRAERLGPPPEREVHDNAVVDLMIHDIDIVRSLVAGGVNAVQGGGVREGRHATAVIEFDSGVVASLSASRLTQRKVRRLRVTEENRVIEVDYLDRSIEVYRRSQPEYVKDSEGGIQHREQSIIEQPQIPSYEPLKAELEEFIEAVVNGRSPKVDGDAGLNAVSLVEQINQEVEREQ
ncbi:Gfo/Idh/MocA family oxidoreductase [Halobacterium salinarum]|uniref:Gfo/Idh/MocA family protein n=1 Tax=Halobacterium salinarum TaxID=2242 RepID=UPI002555E2E1|nr:Gfo/Idh/MocA family oxidoreductase [Halobacterium salinarum]MDL0121106.1 Gfo/Idh/MocA family oxidoreductase [Halobacterium salinarum]MDL0135787.1 Gfo/Idh/MocA family oxidoreductase [Halobacterium salinarum]MDL0138277.1 Gfo/Idh/MocA family oxidoreductase [Halobacterium salinarum]